MASELTKKEIEVRGAELRQAQASFSHTPPQRDGESHKMNEHTHCVLVSTFLSTFLLFPVLITVALQDPDLQAHTVSR